MLGKKNDAHKVLDVDASLQGNLVFKDAVYLNINGHFDGNLETKGDLSIGEHAIVNANITGERITIAGEVTGEVTALLELKLTATGKLTGNIQTPLLTIEKGGAFNGRSSTGTGTQGLHSSILNADEVARYLSVEKSLISEWAENGKLPASRDSGGWKFEKERVDAWIANGRTA